MPYVKQKNDKNKYWVRDSNCISCDCFVPGEYQHRGAIGRGGSKSSGTSFRCMTNAYHGCPDIIVSNEENKENGWRNV